MTTLTYCKALPQLPEQMNVLGYSDFEMLLFDYAAIFRGAKQETVNYLLTSKNFNKSNWNTYLQKTYGVNKRQANGIIADAKGAVDSAKKCQQSQLKQLKGKLKSATRWLTRGEKKLKNARKFYAKKNWQKSKTGCVMPLSMSLKHRQSNWQNLRFQIHNKKRYIKHLEQKIALLKDCPVRVKVKSTEVFIVGSKDERLGNQCCQWDGECLTMRVPYCLEAKYGKNVTCYLGDFNRKQNRLRVDGAKTWHFYYKDNKWVAAVQFTPIPVERLSRHSSYGCIGIDLNPSSVGWAYVNHEGNLIAQGQFPLEEGLPKNKQTAQIVDVCLQLALLADTFSCPIVCEELDFSKKKQSLRENKAKYARMLSQWAYSKFFEQLSSICSNRGIYLLTVNAAYTSLIGLVKYAKMYGIPSDVAAAIAIARRGMRLSEKLPSALTARLEVNSSRHVWHWWNKLNKLIQSSTIINRRHDYYSVSNWDDVVKLMV